MAGTRGSDLKDASSLDPQALFEDFLFKGEFARSLSARAAAISYFRPASRLWREKSDAGLGNHASAALQPQGAVAPIASISPEVSGCGQTEGGCKPTADEKGPCRPTDDNACTVRTEASGCAPTAGTACVSEDTCPNESEDNCPGAPSDGCAPSAENCAPPSFDPCVTSVGHVCGPTEQNCLPTEEGCHTDADCQGGPDPAPEPEPGPDPGPAPDGPGKVEKGRPYYAPGAEPALPDRQRK